MDSLRKGETVTTTHETKPKKRGAPKRIPKRCLTPDCNGMFPSLNDDGSNNKSGVGGRGLCCNCYKAANQLVKNKFTTWDEMEELGLSEPRYTSMMQRAIILARKKRAN